MTHEQQIVGTQGNIAGTGAEGTAASPAELGQTQMLLHKGTLGRESKEREMGESLLPGSILIGRAQMVPISMKLLNAPSVPARRGCCLLPAPISSSPRRKECVCDTKFELSRNPRALLIDSLLRVIIIIKSDFRNCK